MCAVFCGMVMYAHYKNCDPWTADFISAPDQVQMQIITWRCIGPRHCMNKVHLSPVGCSILAALQAVR